MFQNFELIEFIESETAKKMGIDNTPTFEVVAHLIEVCETFLQPLRNAWGKPITITSGFRCVKLNKAVGGAYDSAHPEGYGVDFISEDFYAFCEFVKEFVHKFNIRFDQLIIERNSRGDEWLHFSLRHRTGVQRGQIFNLNVQ